MKNFKNNIFRLLMMITVVTIAGSCKKETTPKLTDLLYDLTVDGNEVTFKTVTKGISAYKWDFGDGASSTDANPVHAYPGKGKYVTTLYATMNGKVTEASTVIRIAKTSPVKFNDGTLNDWATVTTGISLGAGKGVFDAVKMDYDGNYVYLYFEMSRKKADGDIFDVYIDADNNVTTGYLTGGFPDGGYDILLEGQVLLGALDVFYHTGSNQSDFGGFKLQSIAESSSIGTVVESNGNTKFEMRLARGKLKGLTGSGLRIAIQAVKSDWSEFIGNAPDEGSSAYIFDMSE